MMATVYDQDENAETRFSILEAAVNYLAECKQEQDDRISGLEQRLAAEEQARIMQGDALYDLAANG